MTQRSHLLTSEANSGLPLEEIRNKYDSGGYLSWLRDTVAKGDYDVFNQLLQDQQDIYYNNYVYNKNQQVKEQLNNLGRSSYSYPEGGEMAYKSGNMGDPPQPSLIQPLPNTTTESMPYSHYGNNQIPIQTNDNIHGNVFKTIEPLPNQQLREIEEYNNEKYLEENLPYSFKKAAALNMHANFLRTPEVETAYNKESGYNKKDGTWWPYSSSEGGEKTTGYGFKGKANTPVDEEIAKKGYLTSEENEMFLQQRIRADYDVITNTYESIYGEGSMQEVPPFYISIMLDKQFNTKKGLKDFPKLMQAIHDDDIEGIKKEFTTKDTKMRNIIMGKAIDKYVEKQKK